MISVTSHGFLPGQVCSKAAHTLKEGSRETHAAFPLTSSSNGAAPPALLPFPLPGESQGRSPSPPRVPPAAPAARPPAPPPRAVPSPVRAVRIVELPGHDLAHHQRSVIHGGGGQEAGTGSGDEPGCPRDAGAGPATTAPPEGLKAARASAAGTGPPSASPRCRPRPLPGIPAGRAWRRHTEGLFTRACGGEWLYTDKEWA